MDRWSVEIAPYESKTKSLFEYKAQLITGMTVDAHDKTVWNKSTILDTKDLEVAPDRILKLAFIAFRVYVENGPKFDAKGTYDGWSDRFDEWISIYSPRIMPYHTKT